MMYGQMPSNIQFIQLKRLERRFTKSIIIGVVCRIERMGHIISDRNNVGGGGAGASNGVCR